MGFRRVIALVVALLLIGGQAAATPASASAAPAKAAKAKKAKKAKKKKRKRAKKKVVAAKPAPAGPQGPAGPPGPAGTSIVARIRTAAPITFGAMQSDAPALTGASWTQQADEVDDFVGEATMTLPAECTVAGPGPTDDPIWWLEDEIYGYEYVGGAWIDVMLGKEWVGYAEFPVFPEDAGKTVTRAIRIERKLMEPGTATQRELTARVETYCENEGASFRLESLKLNVIGIR